MKILRYIASIIFLCAYGCGLTGKETSPPSSSLYIANVSPDAPALDINLNTNTLAAAYGYGKDSGNFLVFPGTYELRIAKAGTTDNLYNKLVNLTAGVRYSLFLVDSFSMLQTIFTEDNITADTFSTTKIRLFNFMPNSPKIRATFFDAVADTLKYTGRNFNDQNASATYTTFKAIRPNTYSLSLAIDSSGAIFKTFAGFNFAAGKYYTVYLKGFYDNTTVPLDTAVIRH